MLNECSALEDDDLKPIANLSHLERLELKSLPGLTSLHPLTGLNFLISLHSDPQSLAGGRGEGLLHLKQLSLRGCHNLKLLTGIGRLPELHEMDVRDCNSLVWADNEDERLASIKVLRDHAALG